MREEPKERALLLGVKLNDGEDFVRSMEELANLAVACDMEVEGQITQNMERPHSALYMGKGKLSEVKPLPFSVPASQSGADSGLRDSGSYQSDS